MDYSVIKWILNVAYDINYSELEWIIYGVFNSIIILFYTSIAFVSSFRKE